MKIANRVADIEPFHVMHILRKAQALQADGADVIHLEIGEPDFPTPAEITAQGIAALENGQTFYTEAAGLKPLREQICDYYQRQYGASVVPEQVFIAPGASGALLLSLMCTVDVGDSVLMPDPGYPCNRHFVTSLGATAVTASCGADWGYTPSADWVRSAWQEGMVGVMLASPANPTGQMIAEKELSQIQAFVAEQGGVVIMDEIYQGLVYDGSRFSAAGFSDNVIVINSFSKYFGMTGWRLGWAVMPQALCEVATRVVQNLFIAPSTIAQHAALAAFTPEVESQLTSRAGEFQRRRDCLLQELTNGGLNAVIKPEGAFYVYVDISSLGYTATELADRWLSECHVAVTPGRDFGDIDSERFVRFAYTTSEERIGEAMQRIRDWIAKNAR